MKKFSNIQDALDFATLNQYSLRFPFTCKCNGFSLKILSPALARTIDRDRPTLVVTRNQSNALELGYVVKIETLKSLLCGLSGSERQYGVIPGENDVTVFCQNAGGAGSKFSFPLAKHLPDVVSEAKDYVLLLAKPQSSDWHRFWIPLETRLLHSSIASEA